MLGLITSFGLTVFFLVELVRKLPGVETWALAGKRPWGCDLCMSFWTSVLVMVLTALIGDVTWRMLPWLIPGAGAISLVLLYWTASMVPSDAPDLPLN